MFQNLRTFCTVFLSMSMSMLVAPAYAQSAIDFSVFSDEVYGTAPARVHKAPAKKRSNIVPSLTVDHEVSVFYEGEVDDDPVVAVDDGDEFESYQVVEGMIVPPRRPRKLSLSKSFVAGLVKAQKPVEFDDMDARDLYAHIEPSAGDEAQASPVVEEMTDRGPVRVQIEPLRIKKPSRR